MENKKTKTLGGFIFFLFKIVVIIIVAVLALKGLVASGSTEEKKISQETSEPKVEGVKTENVSTSTPEEQKVEIGSANSTPIPTPIPTVAPTPKPTVYVAPTTAPKTNTSSGYTCNCSKTCTQITSCAEAQYQLNVCGCGVRDADHDGIACDSAPLNCQN